MSAILFRCRQIAQSIGAILASADFYAPLRTSLVPTRGAGAPSFTRATTAYVSDYEGVLRQVLSGEARFSGARRVRNLLTFTEDFSNAAWTKISGGAGTVPTVTSGFTDPNGGATAWRLQANRGNSVSGSYSILRQTSSVTPVGSLKSCWIKSNTGATQNLFVGTPSATHIVSATTTWARVNPATLDTNSIFDIGTYQNVGNTTVELDILIWHPQLEDVAGRTDQTTPSDYVSVGVLSSPWHGAGVDGVKCFDTDLSGNVISSSTLKGYLAEGARTNLCLQSQVFDNASWVKLQTTVSTDATIAPDGTLTADKLVESATSGVEHYVEQIQSIVTNQTYAASFYVKAGELTQFAITIVAVGSTYTTSDILFAISAGVITSISGAAGLVSSSITVPVGKGWYRCILIYTLNGTVTSHRIRIYPRQVGLYLGDITKGLYVWGAQLEVGPTATSYIPTTTAAVTRNADVLTYPDTGNISDTAGTSYVEFSAQGVTGSNQQIIARDTNGRFPYVNFFPDRTQLYDGTTQNNATAGASFINSTQKSAQSWGAGTKSISYAGKAIASSAYDGTQGTGAIAIGCNNSGTEGLGGNIRNVCIWLRKLPDAILKRITK